MHLGLSSQPDLETTKKKPYFHRAYGLPWTLSDFEMVEARTESSNQNKKIPHTEGTLPLRRGVGRGLPNQIDKFLYLNG
jgi:hypothetical protein